MSEKQEMIDAQYNELVSAVQALEKQVAKFRTLYEPTDVSLPQFVDSLHDMLGKLDEELALELS
jgi:DNA anti-recombination protein RmuC